MTKLDNSPQRPNAPIFLEDICITHINGHLLQEPCIARVVLRLSPTIVAVIESERFPIGILDSRMELPFVVTVKDRCDIKVVRSSLRVPGSANGTASGSLVIYKAPCTVIQPDKKISSVRFSVFNFPKFYGPGAKWIDSKPLFTTDLGHKNLRITLTEDVGFSENAKILDQDNGYAVTHTGLIKYYDGSIFSVKEAEHILHGLRAFLSFVRGAGCGLILVKVTYPDGSETILEWGTSYTDPWKCGYDTWLPTITDRGNNISRVFPGFWDLFSDPDWKDVLFRAIDLYLNSKSGPFHVGIILVQAALESLCCKIASPKQGGSTGEFLSESIKTIGLCTTIPSSCRSLGNFFKDCTRVGGDGPKAITELRNDLVHAKKNYGDSAEAQMDALRLGQWYIELILLKTINYRGRYRNRLAFAGESPFEIVPWAKRDVETVSTN